MNDRITFEITDGVADVRLVRSDKMNALDDKMFSAITEVGEQLRNSPEVRAVVLSGEGKAFCAGLDMGNFSEMVADSHPDESSSKQPKLNREPLATRSHGITNYLQYAVWMWRDLPMPVIAAVHGVAFGGGFQLALAADMRYAAADTRFSIMEIKWGLVPDMAGTQLMRHLAPEDIVRELSYTGRVFSAQEALEYGFITRISGDPLALALSTAREIATKNPEAIRGNKQLFNAANYLSVEDGLLMESAVQDSVMGTPNQKEAVMAALEKRTANFTN
ncbi:MAG: crotonase/enoyl-CoA hydratase family protein [Pseudomonadales bacterium]|nr:crotonase/enoyl-CoA hydratase family protein [Pseudomonadales bacterium]